MAEVFAMIDKGKRARLRVAKESWQGNDRIDLRVMVMLSETSGIWTATKEGCSLRPDQLGELITALQTAQAAEGGAS